MCCPNAGPPPLKWAELVGRWTLRDSDSFNNATLAIGREGQLSYQKKSGNVSKSISANVSKWEDDSFKSTVCCCCGETFHVEEMPHRDETGQTVMRVNGMTMVKN
eukprot:TRINITY_DN4658_c0_g1_i1.p1 TRINITY_DN4658_c0_g1~~TRINITY_DN4658_c0_g1_i1.p1  ORF type:complete len:105 (+),score=16.49 TRINITY_DN4658_c0_g1_i1:72-386(+)